MAVHLQARKLTRVCFALSLAFFFSALALGTLRAVTARAAAPAASAGVANVGIVDFSFSPSTITVPVGTTVVWTNNGTLTHTTTSDAAVWDSGPLGPGQVFSQTFNVLGTYPYHCNIHLGMHGTVVVVPITVCPAGCNYTKIQSAIDAAPPGGVISITGGVYTENLAITKTVLLYGGYTSNAFAARNLPDGASTVMGDDHQSVVAISGTFAVRPQLDGLKITNGRGAPFGGGIRVNGAGLVLMNSVVSGNHVTATNALTKAYGAGLYVDQGWAVLSNNTFSGNLNNCTGLKCSNNFGGGVLISNSYTSSILSSNFLSNNGWNGGGIAVISTPVTIGGNYFKGNVSGYGGGVYIDSPNTSFVRYNTFDGNSVADRGGALHASGAGPLIVGRNVFTGDVADRSGAIWAGSSVVSLTNNVFLANRSNYDGPGAMELFGVENWAVNNTFINNTMAFSNQAALRLSGSGAFTFANNIFFSHTMAISGTSAGAPVYLTHNDFYGNGLDFGGPVTFTTSGNLIGVDPRFLLPPSNWHIRYDSPMRQAGDPAYNPGVDFDGDVRGSPPDIGADEFAGGVLFLPVIRR